MKPNMIVAVLLSAAVVTPAEARVTAINRHPAAAAVPDSVVLADGKSYKVCKPGMEDDCVQAHQAGLTMRHHPLATHRRHKMARHR